MPDFGYPLSFLPLLVYNRGMNKLIIITDAPENKLIIYQQRKCSVEGCENLCRNKGFYNHKVFYDNVCWKHHKKRIASHHGGSNSYISNTKCQNCGWDLAFCDRHRINPNLGYTPINVKVLCPNCHRLAGLGILKLDNGI